MSPLHNDEKLALLQIARKAVECALLEQAAPEIPAATGNLAALRGAFVTLHCRGRLRGCIGRVAPIEPLAEVVAGCAAAAAVDDPRFPPMKPADLRDLQIELSVLSSPRRATAEEVRPGIHGLMVSQGEKRGVLLPQVAAERHWPRERFLEETCEKAGLAPHAWRRPDTHIEIFTAEVFSESDGEVPSSGGHSAANRDAYSSSQ
jgi:AmmeMemoRadiSam system protein A